MIPLYNRAAMCLSITLQWITFCLRQKTKERNSYRKSARKAKDGSHATPLSPRVLFLLESYAHSKRTKGPVNLAISLIAYTGKYFVSDEFGTLNCIRLRKTPCLLLYIDCAILRPFYIVRI